MSEQVHVALALVEREGRWLVARRSEGRVFAGLWEFPGGKVDSGESAASTAARETREETGLSVTPTADLGRVETCHAGQQVTLHLIRCRPGPAEATPASTAVTDVRWVDLADLLRLPMPPANAEIIERIVRWSEGKPSGPDDE